MWMNLSGCHIFWRFFCSSQGVFLIKKNTLLQCRHVVMAGSHWLQWVRLASSISCQSWHIKSNCCHHVILNAKGGNNTNQPLIHKSTTSACQMWHAESNCGHVNKLECLPFYFGGWGGKNRNRPPVLLLPMWSNPFVFRHLRVLKLPEYSSRHAMWTNLSGCHSIFGVGGWRLGGGKHKNQSPG